MATIKQEYAEADGWSREIAPTMKGYKLACCDCGLVHDVDFWVVEVTETHDDGSWECKPAPDEYRIVMKVRRNNRSTAQVRRHQKKQELE